MPHRKKHLPSSHGSSYLSLDPINVTVNGIASLLQCSLDYSTPLGPRHVQILTKGLDNQAHSFYIQSVVQIF